MSVKLWISSLIIACVIIVAYAHGGHHHSHGEEIHTNPIFDEIIAYWNYYDWKIQAIVATLIVQSVPVIIMSIIYPWLSTFVGDSRNSFVIQIMYAFTFGSLMGDVFFHIFPSLNEHHTQDGKIFEEDQQIRVYYYFIGGMIFSYLFEIFISKLFGDHCHDGSNDTNGKHHEHKENQGHKSEVLLAFFGDFFHNFSDGIAIASTYALSPRLGFVTALAAFIHEFPHEIGDFAYLFKNRYSYIQALSYQLLTGWGAILGTFASLVFSGNTTIEMVAISGGSFVYMSLLLFLNDLRGSNKLSWAIANTISIFVGLYAMEAVTTLESH